MVRGSRAEGRPHPNDSSTTTELEEEIDWIQEALVGTLNADARVVTIYARSKRWWNEGEDVWVVTRYTKP